jgi:hypothetical protein
MAWHNYPQVKPQRDDSYLVQLSEAAARLYGFVGKAPPITVARFEAPNQWKVNGFVGPTLSDGAVISWHEIPEGWK